MPGLSFSYIVDYTESVMCVKTKESLLLIHRETIYTGNLQFLKCCASCLVSCLQ